MKLYILRHGDAGEPGDPRYKENERPLTTKGIQRTKQLAHVLREMEITMDAILTSPLTRAKETAEIVARGMKLQDALREIEHLAPSGSMEELVHQIEHDSSDAKKHHAGGARALPERIYFAALHRRPGLADGFQKRRVMPAGFPGLKLRKMRDARLAPPAARDRVQSAEAEGRKVTTSAPPKSCGKTSRRGAWAQTRCSSAA